MANINIKKRISRRTFLRASGVTVALPWLEAMKPALARGEGAALPRRFVAISNALGFHAPNLFPKQAGHKYKPTRYLRPIDDLREQFTV
ncbi:MAG: hypothetical protein QF473_16370, partial [Planctomycetota bacterium]|nr:hypothetical protein [Planctomycetota bacterium]